MGQPSYGVSKSDHKLPRERMISEPPFLKAGSCSRSSCSIMFFSASKLFLSDVKTGPHVFTSNIL